ncbi:MAG: c-type cytochrome [Syntrophobacterales bacterium]|jgi:uncharacterized membrane protein|nr:c-type cytochrome [Syntrophobacterales bacterium]
MFDFFYDFLIKIGYMHPPHSPLTHMPIGLVVGALILRLTAVFSDRASLARAAFYCLVLALVFAVPTALLGIMDWQHYYSGAWVFPIKVKIALAVLLVILLALGVILGWRGNAESKPFLAICLLSFFAVMGLGYFGGELVLAPRLSHPPSQKYQAGAKIYTSFCAACHPNGGNTFDASLPVRGSRHLKDFDDFASFVGHPHKHDGSPPIMPAFPPEKISVKQMRELYQYAVFAFETPRGGVSQKEKPGGVKNNHK